MHQITPALIRGIASMPNMVQLIICKFIEHGQEDGFTTRAIQCIEYARKQEAQVLNCSWGGARDDAGEFSQKNLDA